MKYIVYIFNSIHHKIHLAKHVLDMKKVCDKNVDFIFKNVIIKLIEKEISHILNRNALNSMDHYHTIGMKKSDPPHNPLHLIVIIFQIAADMTEF